ncbi:MarR family winged helix-turn-helix transcriptional regulator [Balneatrix alpica]|uniref:MarR family winged helix-turn-helix transcriptional regulator n=1 Tax=Balneatrix alpica TaxID=75684 RepID=UPI002738DF7A|nr:MarR family transcriptional regulator [Balneatrix alpica]
MQEHISVDELFAQMKAHWPQAYAGSHAALLSLYRVHDALYRHHERILAQVGLQVADFEALTALRSQGAPYRLTPTELRRYLIMTSGGLTKVLKRLQQQAWVERPANPEDGRSQLVELTAAGLAIIEQAMQAVIEQEHSLADCWSSSDSAQLQQWLEALHGRLLAAAVVERGD